MGVGSAESSDKTDLYRPFASHASLKRQPRPYTGSDPAIGIGEDPYRRHGNRASSPILSVSV